GTTGALARHWLPLRHFLGDRPGLLLRYEGPSAPIPAGIPPARRTTARPSQGERAARSTSAPAATSGAAAASRPTGPGARCLAEASAHTPRTAAVRRGSVLRSAAAATTVWAAATSTGTPSPTPPAPLAPNFPLRHAPQGAKASSR